MLAFVLAVLVGPRQLTIETVRNMSYERNDRRVRLRRIAGTTPMFYQSKLSCDVDGSPNAYHPLDDRLSLDVIESAGGRRKGGLPDGALEVQPSPDVVVFVNGKAYVQPDGEFKGFYVSETTLQNQSMPATDPARYLDARHTQYLVLPDGMVPEAEIGDLAIVYDPYAKSLAAAIYGDIGPSSESGEAALATLRRLGMAVTDGKSSPGQARDDLFFLIFPHTGDLLVKSGPWPHPQADIDRCAIEEFTKWGGQERIDQILKQDPQGGSIPDDPLNGWIYAELASLRKDGLTQSYSFVLPTRFGDSPGRLPCGPEIVVAARAGITSIEARVGDVELGKASATTLAILGAHLTRLSALFRRFPLETADELESVLRETARAEALKDRIAQLMRS
ncbi:MAG: hypothetical protein P4L46_19400 [Fimbriimonas sp.]|nr:hypothetical protein [Fimbriimonas sp.]